MSYIWNYSDPYEYMRRVAKSEMPPLIITVAITGIAGKENNQNVPETPDEQAQEAYRVYQAGAVSVHIHARDETGANCVGDPARCREINSKIRALCPDIIIGNSTAVRPHIAAEESLKVLEADPEICSFNMGAFCVRITFRKRPPPLKGRPNDEVQEWIWPFTFSFHERLARECLKRDVKPELEIYNPSMFEGVQNLIRQDLLKKPYWMQFIFSPIQSGFATPKHLITMIDCMPPDSMFSVIGIGWYQLPLTTMSILLGGHVRVGFEDNFYYQRGELAKSNAQFVERVVRIARELGREIATPAQAREMLGISKTPKHY